MELKKFHEIALSFPETESNLHFDRIAFKVTGKRIFAAILECSLSANIKLNIVDQSVFCSFNKLHIYSVPNKWVSQGWTTFEIDKLPSEILIYALEFAYNEVIKPTKV